MGERNMCQIVDMEIDQQEQGHLQPEPCFMVGDNAHYPHPNIYPVLSTSGSTSNLNMRHFSDRHDGSLFYGSQFNGVQHHHHPVTNIDFGSSSNFYNPCMIPSSGNRNLPIPHASADQLPSSSHHGIVSINQFGGNNHFMNGVRSSSKRKNAEGVPGNRHHVNGSASSSSSSLVTPPLNTGPLQSEERLESGAGVLDAAASVPPEYRVNGVLSIPGGSGRSVRSRSNTLGLQMESSMMHSNHVVQGNFMGQSFRPAAWVEQQFGSNGSDGSTSNWNYTPAIPYINGRSVNGISEVTSMGAQGYSDTMNSRNTTVLLHPPMHHHHHHFHPPPPMQAMHVNNNYHLQPLMPSFTHPTSNALHHGTLSQSLDDSQTRPRYPRPFPSTGLRIYGPHQSGLRQVVQETRNLPRLRIMPEDEVAILEFPGFYEVGNLVDRHRDMRLDIDDMSYEELLALGERIGHVVTGLAEETIIRRLKTRVHIIAPAEDMNSGSETCIVCQGEYENQEKLGTLDCGHEYHADCIRKWLLVKNVCPICKTRAISVVDG